MKSPKYVRRGVKSFLFAYVTERRQMKVNFNFDELENLDMTDFTVVSSNDLFEVDAKAIMGTSCTTCTCCSSCCSV